jgi:glucan-binding YG repeat protein
VTGSQKDAGSSANTYRILPNGAAANYNITQSIGTLRVTPKRTTTNLRLSQSGSSATATAVVSGFVEGENPAGVVQFSVGDNTQSVAVSRNEAGEYSAETTFASVPEGNYTVTATFTPTSTNYLSSTATAIGHKGQAQRTISGTRLYRKTYGDDYDGDTGTINNGFLLDLSLAEDEKGTNDTWSYDIIYDSRNVEALGLGPSVTLSDTNGGSAKVTINHAGKVVLRVTVADGRTGDKVWKDATAYVVIDIAPAELKVKSFAYSKDDTANKTPVTSVQYGQVDTLAYDLQFVGFKGSDGPSTFTTVNGTNHGTLAAVPLVPTIGASETSYQIGIARVAPEGTNAGPFFSCNYNITYDTTTNAVAVTKRPLAIQVLDTAGTYGGDEPTYKWDVASDQDKYKWGEQPCAGLALWDTAESIFTKAPTVTIDKDKTDNKTFSELDAGTYNNALVLSDGASENSQNYGIVGIPGSLVVNPVDLSDTARFAASVQNATYNAEAQVAQVAVVDNAFDPARTLEQGVQYQVQYLGNHTDAGTAHIAVTGMGNYTGWQILDFEIDKATGTIVTPSAAKVYDGTALRAPGAISGILDADRYSFETTGRQTDPGISRNTYGLTFQNPAKANNYAINESLGHLAVVSNDAKDLFVSDVVDYTYDGTEHKQAVTVRNHLLQELVEGVDYTLAYEGDLVNAGTVTITISGTGAYTGKTTRTYQIKPARMKVHTFDAAKDYDGTPLVGDGEVWRLVGDETVTLTVTGTQTEVGLSPNTYTLTWDGTAKEGNYEVEESVGTLTVNDPGDGWKRAKDGTWYYLLGGSKVIGWMQDSDDYWYHFAADGVMDSGWLLDSDGQWYYLSLEHDGHFGYLVSGWHFEWGSWYYLNESHDGTFGSLQNGWLWHCGFWYYLSEQHDGSFGGMLTGWQKIGEYWYYLYPEEGAPQGSCALDTVIDGWRVDASGRWVA